MFGLRLCLILTPLAILPTSLGAQEQTPLSHDTFLVLLQAHDQQRENRMLAVHRPGVANAILLGCGKYPVLSQPVGQKKPIPDTISYVCEERFVTLGDAIAFRTEMKKSSGGADSVVKTVSGNGGRCD